MFYYITFLRPPPLQASTRPVEPLLITPQICNDLRTEFFRVDDDDHRHVDIYYAWSLQSTTTPAVITKPAKLTSWRMNTAYKEIPVPRPPRLDERYNTRIHAQWQLILTCGSAPEDRLIVLGGNPNMTGRTPFAVASMPVIFLDDQCSGLPRMASNKGNRKAPAPPQKSDRGGSSKQECIVRSYALLVASPDAEDQIEPPSIVFSITERTSFDLDKKIWDSGIGLSSWLASLFSGHIVAGDRQGGQLLSDLRESLFGSNARHVLELGAGTGIVAIALSILRSTLDLPDDPGSIVTTDLPSAIPILQDNINSNHHLMTKCTPGAVVLDWGQDELLPPVRKQLEVGLDVIVMADVTYNTSSFDALIGTISRLIQLSKQERNGRRPRVLMAYKERHTDERSLWDRAKNIGLHFEKIAKVDGAGGAPVEIWLG